ncbi:hypothetical protein HZZ00_35290 [Streptomyces sp. NEAU-sy36]|uniref:hypothetical protein n=1 Tax=unclassified Streptomyces TaxID=2593676 RepID=UPI0015D60E0B|nr:MULTISPECIES: hypothetical protein [unclassified Streptomyces]QLJ05770.1 hypothetical protein HZZ00_35290 [Streptomyces sp. NEAU-sy36]
MPHPVLALATAAVTASGCVWYLPALADLRAGADRPLSRRVRAASCVAAWATAATVAGLLLAADGWRPPLTAAATGTLAATALRVCAALRHHRETVEAARHWTELSPSQPPPAPDRTRHVVAVLITTGLTTAAITGALGLAEGPDTPTAWFTTITTPAAILALFVALAAAHTRAAHHRRPTR